MRIALITQYPAWEAMRELHNSARARSREHPIPWVRSLAQALSEIPDIELRIFSLNRTIRRRILTRHEGIQVLFLPQRWPARLDPLTRFRLRSWALRKPIQDFSPDVVHGMGFETGNALVASWLSEKATAFVQGIVEYLVQLPADQVTREIHRMRQCERLAAERMRGIVAETEFAARWARARAPQAWVEVIPHAVRPHFLKAPRAEFPVDPVIFVYVGALLKRKGVDLLMRALAHLPRGGTIRVHLVGDGPERAAFERLASELGISERVVFRGYLDGESLIQELRICRALVCPSRYDTSPNVITEAHAVGLPVIASRVGGIPEMVESGVDGLLVEDGDVTDLAQAMDILAGDVCRAAEMGACGRQKVHMLHSPERVAEQHVAFFHRVLNQQRG